MHLFSHSDSLRKSKTFLRFDNLMYSILSGLTGNLLGLVR